MTIYLSREEQRRERWLDVIREYRVEFTMNDACFLKNEDLFIALYTRQARYFLEKSNVAVPRVVFYKWAWR